MIFLYWRRIYPAPGRKVFPTDERPVPHRWGKGAAPEREITVT